MFYNIVGIVSFSFAKILFAFFVKLLLLVIPMFLGVISP